MNELKVAVRVGQAVDAASSVELELASTAGLKGLRKRAPKP